VLYLCMWLPGSTDTDIVSVHLATDVECGLIGDQSFYEAIFLHFQLYLLAKFTSFHFAGVRAYTSRILYGLKHSRLHNVFHEVILGMPNCQHALAIESRAVSSGIYRRALRRKSTDASEKHVVSIFRGEE
jgi:hypothetical protein